MRKGTITMETKVDTFIAEDVKCLEVNTACAEVIFDTTADNEIRVEADHLSDGIYMCELLGNRLVVSYEFSKKIMISRNHTNTRITLYFPKEFALETVKAKNGAGNLSMEKFSVTCQNMDIEIGAGNCRAEQLSVEQKLFVNVGAGKANLYAAKAGTLDVDCGVGECVYEGNVNGNIDVNCGVGECELRLNNKENDFNYDISCALGKVSVNGAKIKNLGSVKSSVGGDVLGTVTLQCGIGKIELATN